MGEVLSKLQRIHNVSMVAMEEAFAEGGKVKKMELSLRVDYPLSKESARNLVLKCSMALVSELNNNKKLRHHLHHCLTRTDVNLSIFSSLREKESSQVSQVSLVEGEIFYTTPQYERGESESWDEACLIAGLSTSPDD